jgi:hypothetical protein
MSAQGDSVNLIEGPAYALVIGISKYRYGQELGNKLRPEEFPNLRVADKDAIAFAKFLCEGGGLNPNNLFPLYNAEADRAGIRGAFKKLGRKCTQPESNDPLVIVFFSGHGWTDEESRPYLVPYEAKRNDLFGTAIPPEEFTDLLDQLKTNRLVVFIDACHAGAYGNEGAKGALVATYDVRKALGEGEGRFVISSCKPDQTSWEGEEKSIFTDHLIALLECRTDAIDEEEITPFNLYPKLQARVRSTAWEMYGAPQEPTFDAKQADGIVLAINKRFRNRREKAAKEASEKKHRLLQIICDRVARGSSAKKTHVARRLKSYVKLDECLERYEEFYALFDEALSTWQPDDLSLIEGWCTSLIESYIDAEKPRGLAETSRSQIAAAPTDKFSEREGSNPLPGDAAPTIPPPLSSPNESEQRRQLSENDREDILAELEARIYLPDIESRVDCLKEARELRRALSQPVSQSEFGRLFRIVGVKAKDEAFDGIMLVLRERFQERWRKAPVVEGLTVASLVAGRPQDE